jgi:hypothetical protein
MLLHLCSSAVIEYFFLNRELPDAQSTGSMLVVMLGAFAYVSVDGEFAADGISAYGWIFMWYFLLCFQMTYGKILLKEVKMDASAWPLQTTSFRARFCLNSPIVQTCLNSSIV